LTVITPNKSFGFCVFQKFYILNRSEKVCLQGGESTTSVILKYRSPKKHRKAPRSTEKYGQVRKSIEEYQKVRKVPKSTEKHQKVLKVQKNIKKYQEG
jgi:hypothetical protein